MSTELTASGGGTGKKQTKVKYKKISLKDLEFQQGDNVSCGLNNSS